MQEINNKFNLNSNTNDFFVTILITKVILKHLKYSTLKNNKPSSKKVIKRDNLD